MLYLSVLTRSRGISAIPLSFAHLAFSFGAPNEVAAESETGQAEVAHTDVAAELVLLHHAGEFISARRYDDALRLLDGLSESILYGGEAERLRAWAQYHGGYWTRLAAGLDGREHLSGELRFLRGVARLRAGLWEGRGDLKALWRFEPGSVFGLLALGELARSNLPSTYSDLERELITTAIGDLGPVAGAEQPTHERQVAAVTKWLRRRAGQTGRLRAELWLGRGLQLLAEDESAGAVAAFHQALAKAPERSLARVAEFHLAQALRERGRYRAAQSRFASVAADANDELQHRALAEAGQMAVEWRRYEDARSLFRGQLFNNPTGPGRLAALRGLGWVAYRSGDYAQTRRNLTALLRDSPFGAHAPFAHYWRARAAEEIGDEEEALNDLTMLVSRFPIDYYAHRAAAHMQRRGWRPLPGAYAVAEPLAGKLDPLVERIIGLVRANVPLRAKAALGELNSAHINELGPRQLDRLERASRKIGARRLAARLRGHRHRRFPTASSRSARTLRANFPRTYTRILSKAAHRVGLQPELVVAVARQESAFNPRAVSSVGALGLLQLMPQTALSLVSSARAKAGLSKASILNPRLNARLGSKYLAKMLRRYGGEVEFALAAYNAGPTAVSRWRRRDDGISAEVFVEEIPYRETRGYVRRVLQWQRRYEMLMQLQRSGGIELAQSGSYLGDALLVARRDDSI